MAVFLKFAVEEMARFKMVLGQSKEIVRVCAGNSFVKKAES